jgi:hypothetical protein
METCVLAYTQEEAMHKQLHALKLQLLVGLWCAWAYASPKDLEIAVAQTNRAVFARQNIAPRSLFELAKLLMIAEHPKTLPRTRRWVEECRRIYLDGD